MTDPTLSVIRAEEARALVVASERPQAAARDVMRLRSMISIYETIERQPAIDLPDDALAELLRTWSPGAPGEPPGLTPAQRVGWRSTQAKALLQALEPDAKLAHHLHHELEDLRMAQRAWLLEPGREALAARVDTLDEAARKSSLEAAFAEEQAALWQARRDVVARLRATAEALRGTPAEEHAIPTLAASAIDLLPPETGREPSDADPWRALSGALDVLTRWSDGARSEAATAREAARIAAAALADLIG